MRRLAIPCLIACLLAAHAPPACASGDEVDKRGDDFVVTSSTEWCGCGWGGYFPIRIRIQNNSVERTITLRFQSNSPDSPSCEKSLTIAQNATVKTTLSIPVVSSNSGGTLSVYVEGERVQSLDRPISLPNAAYYDQPRPALLAISSGNDPLDVFETAYQNTHYGSTSSGYGPAAEDNQLIDPSLLPETWIDYSGLDLVAVSFATLDGMTNSERSALLEWVDSGGNLIIHDVEALREATPNWQRLDTLLQLGDRAAVGPEWLQPSSSLQVGVPAGYYLREMMHGLLIAMPDPAFSTAELGAWEDLLRNLSNSRRLLWTQRMGMAANQPHDEFLHFLIPSIKSVPVMSFLVLITLFTIVIGPVNYFWLWKKSRLQLLVITIPLIAFVTSFLLLGYSAVSHGFGVRSRQRSVTYLDQRSNEAVCVTRVSYFAGMAPRNGLEFSPETAVFTVWATDDIEPGHIDWTSTQHLESGWLKSRTRTQFVTMTHRDERGRVDFAPDDGALRATNGLEWDLDAILVSDDAGNLFFGTDVPAGGSTDLAAADLDDFSEFSSLLKENAPALPPNAPARPYVDEYSYGYARPSYGPYGGYNDQAVQASFQTSLTERLLMQFSVMREAPELGARSYIAIVRESPGCDIGLEGTSDEASLHILFARY
jgi:hypothetical protein